MSDEMEEGRILAASQDNSYEAALKLLQYAKNLMTKYRFHWAKPDPKRSSYSNDKNYVIPNNWLEELLFVSYRITQCFLSNPEIYLQKKKSKKAKNPSSKNDQNPKIKQEDPYCSDLPTLFTSVLLYASIQLRQIDVLPYIVNKIVQNLICVDLIIPFFVRTDNFMAVSLILNAYSEKMSDFTLLCACIYLSRYQTFNYRCKNIIDKLESKATRFLSKHKNENDNSNNNQNLSENDNTSSSGISVYPFDQDDINNKMIVSNLIIQTIASIRLSLLIHNQPATVIRERCDECFRIINNALEICPDSFQLHYNLAYIYAILGNKDKCYESLQKSLQLKPNDARSVLFMMRLLRSRKQPRAAREFLSKAKKLIYIPGDQKEFNCFSYSKLNANPNLKGQKEINSFLLEDEINYRNIGSRNGNGNQDARKLVEIEEIFATYEANLNPEAKELTDTAKAKYKDDDDMTSLLIRIELMMNSGKKATEMFGDWIGKNNKEDIINNPASFDRQSPEFYFCFAQICLESNDLHLAEKLLKKAIEIEPFNVEYQSALACVLAKLGKMEAALERANFAVKLDPESPHAWIAISGASRDPQQKEQAKDKSVRLAEARVDLSNIHIIIFPQENTVLNI